MRLKYEFAVREVNGVPIAVAVGQDSEKFKGMIKLNASAKYIFTLLSERDLTVNEIVCCLLEKYNVDEQTATSTVLKFTETLRQNELLEE